MLVLLWILALLSVVATAVFTWRSDVRKAVPYPWLTATLRSLAVALIWVLLLAPEITRNKTETEQPIVLMLGDESASIPAAPGMDTAAYRKNFNALADRLAGKYRVVRWGFGQGITDSLFQYRRQSTDISAALTRATELFGQQNLGAVILASDGRFNQGTHPLYGTLPLRAPLYTVALGDTAMPRDIRIPQVYANRSVTRGSQLEIRADVVAGNLAGYNGSVNLSEGGSSLGVQDVRVDAARYDRSFAFTVRPGSAGLHHYVISVTPANGEVNTGNNRRDVFVEVVEEKQKVLLAGAAPHPDINAIREALQGLDKFSLTVTTTGIIPATEGYDVVILHQLPAAGGQPLNTIKKPVWVIVGKATNPAMLTDPALPADLSGIAPQAPHDGYPEANTAFSLFGLPTRLATVADRLPPLQSPGGSVNALPDASVLFTDRSTKAPLWLIRQGARATAVTLGEGLWRWRLYEYRYFRNHDAVDECIRQTVSLLAANGNARPWTAEMPKYLWSDAEPISINAYLLNANNENINNTSATVTITDSAGRKQQYSFDRNGNAYRVNIGIRAPGSYSYTAAVQYGGRALTAAGSFVVSGVPAELMETGADYPLLYSLARKYSGSTVLAPQLPALYDTITHNQNIRPLLTSHTETSPLVDWKIYFFLLLSVLTAEWLMRKYWMAQ